MSRVQNGKVVLEAVDLLQADDVWGVVEYSAEDQVVSLRRRGYKTRGGALSHEGGDPLFDLSMKGELVSRLWEARSRR